MGKVITKKVIERKPGMLYYIDGQGNLCEAKMSHGRKKGNPKKSKKTTKKKRR